MSLASFAGEQIVKMRGLLTQIPIGSQHHHLEVCHNDYQGEAQTKKKSWEQGSFCQIANKRGTLVISH